jgi:hypothetical protein
MSISRALQPLVEALEHLGIAYQVGGSVASSAHGVARSTNDVDLVVDMQSEHVAPLCKALGKAYYAPPELLLEAIEHNSCANVLHLASGFKVDLFMKGAAPHQRAALARSIDRQLEPGERAFRIAALEDILLYKLQWFRAGGEQSDRQWSDVVGMVRLHRDRLDRTHLAHWCKQLGVDDLLARAERDAQR